MVKHNYYMVYIYILVKHVSLCYNMVFCFSNYNADEKVNLINNTLRNARGITITSLSRLLTIIVCYFWCRPWPCLLYPGNKAVFAKTEKHPSCVCARAAKHVDERKLQCCQFFDWPGTCHTKEAGSMLQAEVQLYANKKKNCMVSEFLSNISENDKLWTMDRKQQGNPWC